MPYEAEQDHLLRLFQEVEEEREDPIDEESSPEENNADFMQKSAGPGTSTNATEYSASRGRLTMLATLK
ncbi:hypothetical protein ILUMI_16681 [Ignelater luminosus]|uniref:Uncharacterized protein n=1 Tax=Ignelater luminosus TaxID=2038154 RepID=A0A8K0CSG5_IGNLU|nr:hypothetical protein ILUMI_16681 [Ignelater luminosus]